MKCPICNGCLDRAGDRIYSFDDNGDAVAYDPVICEFCNKKYIINLSTKKIKEREENILA
jgi:hypothetical protein